jgi:hypothetical protein
LGVFGLQLDGIVPEDCIISNDRSVPDEVRVLFVVRDGAEADNVLSGLSRLFDAVRGVGERGAVLVQKDAGYATAASLEEVKAAGGSDTGFTLYYRYAGMVVRATVEQRSAGAVWLTLAQEPSDTAA